MISSDSETARKREISRLNEWRLVLNQTEKTHWIAFVDGVAYNNTSTFCTYTGCVRVHSVKQNVCAAAENMKWNDTENH